MVTVPAEGTVSAEAVSKTEETVSKENENQNSAAVENNTDSSKSGNIAGVLITIVIVEGIGGYAVKVYRKDKK